jgi:hypothetical protein
MRTVVGTAAAECVRVHTVTAVNSWACWLAGLQFAGRLTLHRSRPGRASAPGGGEGVLYMANARRTRRPKPVISGSGCEPVASPPPPSSPLICIWSTFALAEYRCITWMRSRQQPSTFPLHVGLLQHVPNRCYPPPQAWRHHTSVFSGSSGPPGRKAAESGNPKF